MMNHAVVLRMVFMKTNHANHDSQYGTSDIPIILMDSLMRDSFSETIKYTVLYTGGMYMTKTKNGNSWART